MRQRIARRFLTKAPQQSLFELAGQPLLGPHYLNFLVAIGPATPANDATGEWTLYNAEIAYRGLLKAKGQVAHQTCHETMTAQLRHDGPLIGFEASFVIQQEHVDMTCDLDAKVPLIQWLVKVMLARALVQVAAAMDTYARHCAGA
jgi:hypothetical protein